MSQPSTKPYLIRAIYEWCVDGGFTPYISVQVDGATRVPLEFVRAGMNGLKVGPAATRNLTMSNDRVEFFTRFNGVSREVSVPVGAVTGIFARENGEGLAFQADARVEGEAVDSSSVPDAVTEAAVPSAPVPSAAPPSGPIGLTLAEVSPPRPPAADTPEGPATPPTGATPGAPPRGRPSLRVIK